MQAAAASWWPFMLARDNITLKQREGNAHRTDWEAASCEASGAIHIAIDPS